MGPAIIALVMAAQTAATATPAAPKEKPRTICRESQQETGSHIRTGRRCKTEAEWEREDAERTRMSPSTRITEGQGDGLTKPRPQ